MNELAIDRERVYVYVPVRIAYKVRKMYAKEGDVNNSTSFVRALEEATRELVLTQEDYVAIGEIVESNRQARMAKRQENFSVHGIKPRRVRKATQAKLDALKATYANGGDVEGTNNGKKNTKGKN